MTFSRRLVLSIALEASESSRDLGLDRPDSTAGAGPALEKQQRGSSRPCAPMSNTCMSGWHKPLDDLDDRALVPIDQIGIAIVSVRAPSGSRVAALR